VVADVASIDLYQEDSASPLTASKPVAFTSGDRLIFSLTEDGGLLSAITLPSGWTLIGTVDASSQRGKAAYHDFAGGEPATWDFAYDGGSSVSGAMIRITGANLATAPVCVTAFSNANLSSMDSPTVTPSGSNDLLICTYSNFGGGTALSYTVPSGMTNLGSVQVTGNHQCSAFAKQLLVTGSATGAKTWTSLSPTGGPAGTFSIAIKSATVTASQSTQPLVISPPRPAVPVARAYLSASLPLGNPAVPTPGPRVVSPQPGIVPVPGARLFAAPQQPGAPRPLVVSPPFSWPYIPPVTVSASQPLGNPATGTGGPLVVSSPWAAKVPGAQLFANSAAPAAVTTTTTPGPLVVTPPFSPVPVPTAYLSASRPLGNPAVATPGLLVSTPAPTRTPIPGAQLFAGAPGTAAPAPLVVSTFTLATVPGARVFGAPAAPTVAATPTPAPLVVTPPWAPVPIPRTVLSASLPLGRPAVASPQPLVVSPPHRWPVWTPSLVTASLAVHSCVTPRPDTGITARPGSGTTTYNRAMTARPSTGTTARPDTGITSPPC
jgi:hypothetical protein